MSRRADVGLAASFAVLSVALVGALWVVPYLPTNDGPEAILAVHIENHFADPGTLYRDVFLPAPQFAGRGFTVLFEPLEAMLGWRRGLQVALSIIVLTEAWGFVAFVRAVDPRRTPLGILGFPLALSYCLYMGFFPFVFASGVGLFVLAVALRHPSPSPWMRGLVAALLLIQAFMHVFAAALTGVALAALRVAASPRGKRWGELWRVALTGVPAAALAVTAYVVASKTLVAEGGLASFEFVALREEFLRAPRTLMPGPLARAIVATCVVGGATLVAAWRALKTDSSARDRALAGLAVAFLLTGLFGPQVVPGWQFFSQRFVWLGAMLALAAVPFERVLLRSPAGRQVATALLVLVGLGWAGGSYPFHLRLAAEYRDAIAGLAATVERHTVVLPVTLEPYGPPSRVSGGGEVPYLAPLRHIGALYAAVEGGLIPYTFANNGATWPFTVRPDALRPPPVPPHDYYDLQIGRPEFQTDPVARETPQNELASYGMYYEGVVVTGARPRDLALWKRRGYVADWEQGSAMVAHFEPCSLDVVVPREGAAPLLDFGVGESGMAMDKRLPVVVDADGRRHLIDHGPCGDVWVRPHWSAPDGTPRYCSNARDDGALLVQATRQGGAVVCDAKL